ncbi:MAG: hypothetical protein V3T15_05975, partial [Pseudomonadales bacterium]
LFHAMLQPSGYFRNVGRVDDYLLEHENLRLLRRYNQSVSVQSLALSKNGPPVLSRIGPPVEHQSGSGSGLGLVLPVKN